MSLPAAKLSIYDTGHIAKDGTDGIICAACLPLMDSGCECCGMLVDNSGHFPVIVEADTQCAECHTTIIVL